MSDDKSGTPRPDDETQPVRHEGEGTPASEPAVAPGRRGFRERLGAWRRSEGDRTFGLAALIASALAGIIVGGLGFATFHAVTDDRDRDRDRGGMIERRHTEGDRFGGRGGRR